MDDTSKTLLQRLAQEGKEEDWQRLLRIYEPFIRQQIRRFPQLREQSDDIYQEIVAVLVQDLPSFERRSKYAFRGWLKRIAQLRLLAAARKLKRHPIHASSQAAIEATLNEWTYEKSDSSQRWNEEHDREVMNRALEVVRDELNPLHWEAFRLYVLDGLSALDVAEKIGISVNVVRLIKSRVLKRVRTELAGIIDS